MTTDHKTPLRWSLNRAAEETGFARQTVKNRMVVAGINPGEDGCYSTQQILAALFGDYEGERTRKTKAEANLTEAKLAQIERTTLDTADVEAVWRDILANLRGVVQAFDMSKEQRHQLIGLLREIPLTEYVQEKPQPDAEAGASAT